MRIQERDSVKVGIPQSLRKTRGGSVIADRGLQLLEQHPERVDNKVLEQFPEFLAFRARRSEKGEPVGTHGEPSTASVAALSPTEAIERLVSDADDAVAAELLDRILAQPPAFLEDRARPAVGDDHRQRVLALGPDVNEVDVEPVDLRDELRLGMQLRLALVPVVVGRPVARELLHQRQRHTLRVVVTVSRSGQLAAATRLRSSVSSASGKPTRKARMLLSSTGIFIS
jgi:hypothetical protein